MARELAFAFGNETPQARHWGLIIFMAPISPCRLPGKDGFQFLGQLPISWVLCPLHRTEEMGQGLCLEGRTAMPSPMTPIVLQCVSCATGPEVELA